MISHEHHAEIRRQHPRLSAPAHRLRSRLMLALQCEKPNRHPGVHGSQDLPFDTASSTEPGSRAGQLDVVSSASQLEENCWEKLSHQAAIDEVLFKTVGNDNDAGATGSPCRQFHAVLVGFLKCSPPYVPQYQEEYRRVGKIFNVDEECNGLRRS
jgi:hypothetical protein